MTTAVYDNPPCSTDELMCVSVARLIEDGDVLMEGIGAFLPTAGYELARATHAPHALAVSPIGSVFRSKRVPLSLERYEESTFAVRQQRFTYGEMALWHLPAGLRSRRARWLEFMRPGQVDRDANTNNVAIGDYASPTTRLPGAIGLPDATLALRRSFMYVPRHDRRTFVKRVDFASTVGLRDNGPAEAPPKIVTNLGVFSFRPQGGLFADSIHPGVAADDVRSATGFEVEIPSSTPSTESPSATELQLLREEIDPLGLRRLELVPRTQRYRLIREILRGRRDGEEQQP